MALDIFKELGLDDDTTINNAIAKLERLNNAIEVMAANARKSSETYSNALDSISKSADTLEKSLSELDATNKKDQSTIASQSKQVDELSSDYDKYTKSLKLNEAELLALIAAQDKLTSSKEKLKKGTTDEAGSLNDLRKQLTETVKAYQAMGTATDQTIKDSTLTKIKDLSKAVNDTDKALKEAKKGADAAAGSYDALSAKIIASRRELKAMEGGIGNTSKEFKALQAQIKADSEALKEFDKSVDQNQRNVGNYPEAMGALDQATGGAIGKVQQLGKAFIALVSNPIVAFIAVLVAGFAALKSAVTTFYDTTLEGEEAARKQTAAWDAFFITARNGWASIGKSASEFFGENGLKGLLAGFISYFAPSMLGTFLVTASKADELAAHLNAIFKEHIRDVVDDAHTELAVNKLLEESKDKLAFSDEQRLEAIRKSRKLIADQLSGDVDLAQKDLKAQQLNIEKLGGRINYQKTLSQYTDKEILDLKVKGEEVQKLANLEAALIKVQSDASLKNRSLYKIEQALVLEIEKAKRDAANAEIDTARQVDLFLLADQKRTNDELLKQDHLVNDDRLLTMEERQSLIGDSGRAELEALKIQKAQELDVVKRAAEDRARASVPVDQVETAVAGDQGLTNQIDLINKKYDQLSAKNKEVTDSLKIDNVFKVIARDAQIAQDQISTITDQDLIELNNQLNKQLISYKDYEKKKVEIQGAGARTVLRQQIENLELQLTNTKLNAAEDAAITKKIYDLKLALSNSETAETIANEKEKEAQRKATAQAAIQLSNEVFSFLHTSLNAETQDRIAESEKQLQDLSDKKDARLKLVGDDKQAQSAIEADFAQKQKVIQDKINKEKHDAAVKEKALNLVQAIINTARAVTAALPNYPLAILTGIIGGLQIAAIQKQSIPAYAKGTEDAPEGYALVGEAGREIVYDKKTRKAQLYDTPTVTFLNKGSIVKNNKTTEDILSMADVEGINNTYSRELEYVAEQRRLEFKTQGIIASVDGMRAELVDAVKYAGGQHVFDELGYRKYNTDKSGKVLSLNKRYQQNG